MNTHLAHCRAQQASQNNQHFAHAPMRVMHRRPKYNVPVNIVEQENSFEVSVYATGFTKEHIKISIIDDLLYITGTKELDPKDAPRFVSQEFPIKNFERILSLREGIDRASISAEYKEGILVVTLLKSKEAKTKEFSVAIK